MTKLCITFLMLFVAVSAIAKPAGWHWYNALPVQTKQSLKKHIDPIRLTPTQQMARQTQAVNEAKALAILNPTIKNVTHFYQLQQQAVAEASAFGQASSLAFLLHPELNYLVKSPSENSAQPLLQQLKDRKAKKILEQLSNQYVLFYFYRGKNLLDQLFAQTVKAFANQYHFSFLAISTDGVVSDIFLKRAIDHGQMETLNVKTTPALILFDPKTQTALPYRYGFASLTGLTEQAFLIEQLVKRGASDD